LVGRVSADDVRVLRHTGQTRESLARLVEGHERALESGADVLKQQDGAAVTRVRTDELDVCVKQYRRGGLGQRLKDWLRPQRGERAWRAADYLARRGVQTPEAVALLERGDSSYLLTRFVCDALPLNQRIGQIESAESREGLAVALGAWLGQLHALGVYHDDCSAKNVLSVARAGGGWDLWLIDLDGVSPTSRLSYRRRVKNLSQVIDPPAGLTRDDVRGLLDAYTAVEGALEVQLFARDVRAAAERRLRARERRAAARLR
jgi:tRNA A-37 threonylcarbamoyl transferase component Bud32